MSSNFFCLKKSYLKQYNDTDVPHFLKDVVYVTTNLTTIPTNPTQYTPLSSPAPKNKSILDNLVGELSPIEEYPGRKNPACSMAVNPKFNFDEKSKHKRKKTVVDVVSRASKKDEGKNICTSSPIRQSEAAPYKAATLKQTFLQALGSKFSGIRPKIGRRHSNNNVFTANK